MVGCTAAWANKLFAHAMRICTAAAAKHPVQAVQADELSRVSRVTTKKYINQIRNVVPFFGFCFCTDPRRLLLQVDLAYDITPSICSIATMFKSLAICSLVAGAAAFAPASQQKASTALRAFDDEVSLYVPRSVAM